ncbi:hypothetical protein ACWEP5_30875 [Nocardia niigatensis]
MARRELNQSLTEPFGSTVPQHPRRHISIGAVMPRNSGDSYRVELASGIVELGTVSGFRGTLREVGWSAGEVAEKLVDEIGDRCLRTGAALVQVTEFKSADAAYTYQLCFIDASAADRLDAISTAIGRDLLACRTR